VGGAILTHGIPALHHWIEHTSGTLNNAFLQAMAPALLNGVFGVIAGAAALLLITITQRIATGLKKPH